MMCNSPHPNPLNCQKKCRGSYLEKKSFKWPVNGQTLNQSCSTAYLHHVWPHTCWIGWRHFRFGTDVGFGTSVSQDGSHLQSQPPASTPFSRRRTLHCLSLCGLEALAAISSPNLTRYRSSILLRAALELRQTYLGTPSLHSINCWPWTTDLNLSKLIFLICKIRIMVPTFQVIVKI